MTTLRFLDQSCAVCGTQVRCSVLGSTNAFGSPDLDLRPPEMQRSTMSYWLQECSACGFVNADLAEAITGAAGVLASPEYQAVLTDEACPPLARRFARFALLRAEDLATAGLALVHAAWACDDGRAAGRAAAYRSRAADLLSSLPPPDETAEDDEARASQGVRVVDLLRRAGRFAEARALAARLADRPSLASQAVVGAVLRYQQRLIGAGDAGRHTIQEAMAGEGGRVQKAGRTD